MPQTLALHNPNGGTDTFTINPIVSAWDTFALQPLFGPGVMELFGLFGRLPEILALRGDGEDVADLDVMQVLPLIAPVVGRALGKIPPDDLRKITSTLFDSVIVQQANGQPAHLNDVFAALMKGRTFDTWRLLYAAFKENYPDFFALLPAKGAKAGKESLTAALGT